MFDNIIGEMKKIVALSSTAIAPPIVYQHRNNSSITAVTNTYATTESLENYKIDGDVLADGRRFIVSRHINIDDSLEFLNEQSKKNDTISYEGKIWYVVTTNDSDVELVLICTSNIASIPKATKRYEI